MKFLFVFFCITSILFSDEGMDMAKHIEEVENGLLQAVTIEGQELKKKNILLAMEEYAIPAVSVAVINDGKIEWAKAYGVVDAATKMAVDTETIFQAGSISKAVAAVGIHSLVQKGMLQLDADVNQFLCSWKIAENEYTKSNNVTLRHLLSHTAGFNVIGFDGYYLHDRLPTLLQILEGAKPANNPSLQVEFLPGSKLAYSGGGYSVMQQLVEDLVGSSFAEFMDKECLQKLGMTRSTFHYPIKDINAAHSHTGEGTAKPMKGGWKTYPESAAAGLWTTPTELARLLIDLHKSYHAMPDAKILKSRRCMRCLSLKLLLGR